jgi:hypothetical protein
MPSRKYGRKYKKGGGCSCENSHTLPSQNIMRGGGALGPASLTNFDPNQQYSYGLNSHNNDPQNPTFQDDTRMDPNANSPWVPSFLSGGKKRKSKKVKKTKKTKKVKKTKRSKTRKYRGGSDEYIHAQNNNILLSTEQIENPLNSATVGANIIAGKLDILNAPQLQSVGPFI